MKSVKNLQNYTGPTEKGERGKLTQNYKLKKKNYVNRFLEEFFFFQ